ncbi:MAG: 1-acyl-sn-glycerol-3-phosphate acyltransferase [Deltaproteobacteria bacterium]|nr:1-acyl-sn-glycerol-3-phosphate acyltransferase [Deltaproteobacteria bacterium]
MARLSLKVQSQAGLVSAEGALAGIHKSPNEAFTLRLQRFLGRLCLLPIGGIIIGLMRWRAGYRVLKHQEIRQQFRDIALSKQPLLVCSNHLTMIDSVILMWALASIGCYACNYRLFCWNLPAAENTKKKKSWRFVTYISKCILVDRLGDTEHTNSILDTVCGLLRRGDLVMLFPEGTRSRSGRVDLESVTYGVGKILQEIPDCQVLCAYLRGAGQETYSDFPKRNEVFSVELEVMKPESNHSGLRGARDQSRQVIAKLKEMEDRHFAAFETRDDR